MDNRILEYLEAMKSSTRVGVSTYQMVDALDIRDRDLFKVLNKLQREGKIHRHDGGSDYFWSPA